MTSTHFYAVAPGRCRYLGSRVNPSLPDPSIAQAALARGEQLLLLPHHNQEAAHRQALLHAQALITPDLIAWPGGPYLHFLRDSGKITLEGLQQASQVVRRQIGRLEHGKMLNPQYTTLAQLAYALDIPLCDLLAPPAPPWDHHAPRALRSIGSEELSRLGEWHGGSDTKARREAANLSQADLALVAGLKPNQISLIETDKVLNPTYETLARLALGLSTTVCDLIADVQTDLLLVAHE